MKVNKNQKPRKKNYITKNQIKKTQIYLFLHIIYPFEAFRNLQSITFTILNGLWFVLCLPYLLQIGRQNDNRKFGLWSCLRSRYTTFSEKGKWGTCHTDWTIRHPCHVNSGNMLSCTSFNMYRKFPKMQSAIECAQIKRLHTYIHSMYIGK